MAEIKYEQISDKNVLPLDIYRYISWFYRVIKDDYIIHKCNDQYLVSSEEGLIHNLGSCFKELERKCPEFFYLLMQKRKVIFCDASPEVTAERILKRLELTGRIVPQHKNLSFKELTLQLHRELEEKRSIVNWLQRRGVECLSINTEERAELNALKVESFITTSQREGS